VFSICLISFLILCSTSDFSREAGPIYPNGIPFSGHAPVPQLGRGLGPLHQAYFDNEAIGRNLLHRCGVVSSMLASTPPVSVGGAASSKLSPSADMHGWIVQSPHLIPYLEAMMSRSSSLSLP
jgi:hypothetical protein